MTFRRNVYLCSILGGVFVYVGFAAAKTNCDDQAKPALGCPPGYTVMCIPVGGDHWGCGKELNGIIVEAESTADTAITMPANLQLQTNTNTSAQVLEGDPDRPVISGQVPSPAPGKTETIGANKTETVATTTQEAPKASVGTITIDGARIRTQVASGKVEVRGWDPKEKKVIVGSAEIQDEDGLRDFAQAVAVSDANIKRIVIKGDLIQVNYKMPAKFLGFIPITLTANVTVSYAKDVGTVKVKFPWLSFLSYLPVGTAEMANGISGELNTIQAQNAFQKTAQMISLVSNIMKTSHETAKSIIQNIRA